jgi:hypothetical protein
MGGALEFELARSHHSASAWPVSIGSVSEAEPAEPAPEVVKIITLARAARARAASAEGAAVRDETVRTYAAAAVTLPSPQLSALHLAVAMAVSSGATSPEAAALVSDGDAPDPPDAPGPRLRNAADTLPLPSVHRTNRWRTRWPLLLVLVWAALAAVNIVLFGVGSSEAKVGATRTTTRPHIAVSAATPSVSTPSPSAQPTLTTQTLVPVSAAAYGPTGPGSGDDPNGAADVIEASAAAPWQTDWYRSAAFGNLQAGTGLLIDMGQPVTITSVRITLGSTPGADLELLTGTASERSQMRVQASVSDVGGTVSLALAEPESARYLLIWFTLLPPDAAGTFQATVYNVRVEGTP